MLQKRFLRFLAVFATFYSIAVLTEAQNEHEADEIARLITDAATCIFYPHFDAWTPDVMFDERELEILEDYKDQVNVMIQEALGRGDSVCGAYFSQRFGLQQNLDLLRWHILEPGKFYGWEGSYRADGEHIYEDRQYVYGSKYISVAESLAGEAVKDFIDLTDAEEARILGIANDADHESHEWALWILRKLEVR